jgi:pyruvate/2-oxoglutarate dehydrogenase complex dihydrolipoamide acyltransferase (E2) component
VLGTDEFVAWLWAWMRHAGDEVKPDDVYALKVGDIAFTGSDGDEPVPRQAALEEAEPDPTPASDRADTDPADANQPPRPATRSSKPSSKKHSKTPRPRSGRASR